MPMDGDQPAIVSWVLSPQAIISGKTQMAEGTIKKLTDKGFGFIKTGGHKGPLLPLLEPGRRHFEELREGQKVSYTEGRGPKARVPSTSSRYNPFAILAADAIIELAGQRRGRADTPGSTACSIGNMGSR